MKRKNLKMLSFILLMPMISSCSSIIDKYVGTYELSTWSEYDAIYYFAEKQKEENTTYGKFSGQIIIEKNKKATFVYSEAYNRDDEAGSVFVTKNYLRFKNCPIPYEYKFEYKENYYVDGERHDCLTFYSSKLTDGFIFNRTEHKINCVIKRIN